MSRSNAHTDCPLWSGPATTELVYVDGEQLSGTGERGFDTFGTCGFETLLSQGPSTLDVVGRWRRNPCQYPEPVAGHELSDGGARTLRHGGDSGSARGRSRCLPCP